MKRIALLSIALALAAGCAATKLVSQWRDPATTQVKFNKVLAVMMSPEMLTRRSAEDSLVRILGPDRTVASYMVFPGEKAPEQEAAKALLREKGFEGVVILRPVDSRTEVQYVPGTVSYAPTYGSLWGPGYWGYGWGSVYEPGYVTQNTIVRVETVVYDLKQDKLIWASQTDSTNPTGLEKMIAEIAEATAFAIKKQGLIP
ncbi:MAG TPA: hypothetical protein VF139_18985 [Candidatus Polarisedimenticolaceae bacterium]